jgi:uncharacterized protein (TIGR03437 family)
MRIGVRFLLLSAISALSLFAQAPEITAVVNGFSFKSHISPGVLASIFGSNLSGNNLEVTVKGQSCPVTYTSASQLNIQVPWEVSTGAGSVIVKHDNLTSKPFKVTVSEYSPALASADGSGSGIGIFYTANSKLITTTNPANAGDTLVTYAVGLGATNPAIATGETTPNPPPLYVTLVAPAITVGGKSATIFFSGLAPGVLATDQLNFSLATDTTVGTDTVTLTAGSSSSSAITIPIGCLDNTAGVMVTQGPLENPSANKYTQKVTIQNTSGKRLQTKGSLVLTGLTASAQLTNGGGKSCPSSDGAPYKSFTFTGAGTAQTATVTLDFTDTSTGTIAYGQRVLTK